MINKFYILILSKDDFLKKVISENFGNEDIKFIENIKKDTSIHLAIFDDINKINSLIKLKKKHPYLFIINISEKILEIADQNIKRPLEINKLLCLIRESIQNIKNKNKTTIYLSDCEVQIHKRIIVKNKEVLDTLTEKEIEIMEYLNITKNVNKKSLLNKVWHYDPELDTKVVESNIYKLRQKFKKHNLQNPILFKDGVYKLNN
jgi:hypothetical protein